MDRVEESAPRIIDQYHLTAAGVRCNLCPLGGSGLSQRKSWWEWNGPAASQTPRLNNRLQENSVSYCIYLLPWHVTKNTVCVVGKWRISKDGLKFPLRHDHVDSNLKDRCTNGIVKMHGLCRPERIFFSADLQRAVTLSQDVLFSSLNLVPCNWAKASTLQLLLFSISVCSAYCITPSLVQYNGSISLPVSLTYLLPKKKKEENISAKISKSWFICHYSLK